MINERREWPFTEEDCEALLFLAERNPRKRAREVVGVSQEGACIILNAVLPDFYIRPHKYKNSHTPDTLVAVKGLFKVLFFDDEGAVTDTVSVCRGHNNQTKEIIDIPANIWHSVVALVPCFFAEVKREFEKEEVFAPWAPEEGTEEAKVYLETLREKVVDKGRAQG